MNALLKRIPVVRTIYDVIQKLVQLFARNDDDGLKSMSPVWLYFGGKGKEQGTVVLVYLGLLLYVASGLGGASAPAPWLVYLALTGSLMVSYVRARSEAVGHATKVGLLTRFERMSILWLGLLVGQLKPVLVIIAVGAWFTAGQRIVDVWRQIRCSDR